jgi:hypothetical protein
MRCFRSTVTVLAIVIATSLYAHNPETLIIKAAQKKQPPVKGLTAEHATATNVIKCTVCHLDPKKPGMPGMREMSLTKNPFHIRCIGCHKEQKKGPVVCTGCHKKT